MAADRWRKFGALTQGLVLGVLLFIAILVLFSASGDARIFQYQGF